MIVRMEHGTILLVDDDPLVISILADLLEPLGHTILCATNGPAALQLAAKHIPDLVLLDVMMPEMDGFTVCRRLRSDPLLAHVPIILITALEDRTSRVQGFEAGADEFVTKPVDYVELCARVSTILRLNRYRRLLEQEQRLAAEHARFVWAVEQSEDGILILDQSDLFHYLNPSARSLLGLSIQQPLHDPFLMVARRRYSLIPPEAWDPWPRNHDDPSVVRFLVHPETRNFGERWLRVDLLPPHQSDNNRVVRLRDVTEQITTQREMWTFHAMLGHKLRTPLVGILGGLNILSGGATSMDRESIVRITEVALSSARRLRAEIEDILHYLRPPADIYGVDGPTLDELAPLVEHIAIEFGVRHLKINQQIEGPRRRLLITRHSLEIALREVIENCVKFHLERDPQVEFNLRASDGDQATLMIADNGPGLSPAQLQRAWAPYYQGERSFTGQIEGMGLGLALVARVVHAIGGHCELTNRSDGEGAIITLSLPLGEPLPSEE